MNSEYELLVALSYTPPTTFLAGIDDILFRCINACIREFLLHSMTNSVHGCEHRVRFILNT